MRGIHQTGLRPGPPASACGDPTAPRRYRRGAPCAASIRRGCAPDPRRPLAGTPQPRAATAEARRARHPSDGAAPRTPGVRLRGPHSPAPLPPRRAVRGIHQTGLRPGPPASACGDPTAPRRYRRGAPCAPCHGGAFVLRWGADGERRVRRRLRMPAAIESGIPCFVRDGPGARLSQRCVQESCDAVRCARLRVRKPEATVP